MKIIKSFLIFSSCLACLSCQPSNDELIDRLQTLEDKDAIRKLLIQYGHTLDYRQWQDFADLYAIDGGTWEGGFGTLVGREAIMQSMLENIGDNDPGQNFHFLANEVIDVSGDLATARSKWIFFMNGEQGEIRTMYLGHYDDKLIREQGEWKFSERVVSLDLPSSE